MKESSIINCLSRILCILTCTMLMQTVAIAQQQITVNVSPSVSVSINGQLMLDRKKYFNLATPADQIVKNLNDQSRFDYYFRDLEMTVGRQLSLVHAEKTWGNSLREDAGRPGYMDVDYFISKKNPSDNGLSALQDIFGLRQGLVTHDRHNAYPDFMDQYTIEGANGEMYPTDNDAAAEMVAILLKYRYTDFQRPTYFELVNEPHWKFWGDMRFAQFHTKAKAKVDEMGIDTEVGGPCYSVSNLYKNEYGNLTTLTKFIDNTNFELDFYSFHSYDYMRWDDNAGDFVGSVSSGLPIEGVIDAVAAYTYHNFGKEFSYVGSEHGGYMTDSENRTYALNKLADQYFPGSGFQHEMQKRTIDNFIMVNSAIANTLVFMNHPHIVKKSVPFILLESAGWDPYYYSSLLVKENFDKNSSNWAEARLIDFYRYFAGVRGRRVESFISDTDIQHMSFVDGKTLIMLFHNQSNESGEIDVEIEDIGNSFEEMKIRKLSRANDFRPVFEEMAISSLNNITIGTQESIVLFVTYQDDIVQEDTVNEVVHYSEETGTKFNGSKTFAVNIPEHKKAKYAIVRVGVSRDADNSKEINIKLNGISLNVPIEDCADRITQMGQDYATTKIIKVEGRLLTENNTIEVSFPDGKSGGVGAVAIRVGLMDEERQDVVTAVDNFPDHKFMVYPNPTEGVLMVDSERPGKLQIINTSGKIVLIREVKRGITTVAANRLSPGIYIIQLINEQAVKTTKILLN